MVNFAYRIETELEAPILSKWAELGFEAETYTAYDGDPCFRYGNMVKSPFECRWWFS